MTKVACIGAGSFGTTMAGVAAQNANDVVLWCRRGDLAEQVNERRTNEDYLPGIRLPDGLSATADIEEAMRGASVCIMAVPSHGWREILRTITPFLDDVDVVVSLTKGLEVDTNLRMSEVLFEECPDFPTEKYAMLSGPNIAREIARKMPAATAVGCTDEKRAELVQNVFHQPYFRVYTNNDVVGCELGGAIKNIVAIAAGIADTMGFGDNAMAALMTRGLAELTRLGTRLGGQPLTFAGLAGMGDLIVTCVSKYSRNRRVGKELGKGRKIDDIIAEMNMVAEGVKTSRPILELGRKVDAWMPITEGVVSLIYEGSTPDQMVADILARPAMAETYGIEDA
ncbi:MAG TPA: NAD(P)H-dependent glycerol-3-phosphate dehydrogenase [Actinomycetota bacterium]|jgi:glycerol-3-phosphate dehydrogenase (NAD(P)+)|nr:NAD(P)H-dependent glycerol-3-phosphate dehydrogenase [Actinomycetota bacterium]